MHFSIIQILSLPIRDEIDRNNMINVNERQEGIRTEEDEDQSEIEGSQDTSTADCTSSDENLTSEFDNLTIDRYSETNP